MTHQSLKIAAPSSRMGRLAWSVIAVANALFGLVGSDCGGAESPKEVTGKSAKIDFTREVRPILAGHCFKCHGQDEGSRKAKLRLDVRETAIKPAKSDEVAIVPGKPDQSELVRRILADNEDDLMPPPAAKNPLTQTEREVLKRWIAQGAEY